MDRITVKSVFVKAIESGGRQISPFEVEWDISGNCLFPVRRELCAFRPFQGVTRSDWGFKMKTVDSIEDTFCSDLLADQKVSATYGRDKLGPYSVLLTVRCRLCDNCLKVRRNQWAARAIQEFATSSRTWFGTLTLSPQWHSHFGALAAQKVKRRRGEDLEAQPFDVQLQERANAIFVEITKWFKRLRKAGHTFRYFIVLEAHESGLPHFHILVHETGAPITKRDLEASWPFGFSSWRLADDRKAIWYVAKYLGKSAAARVRASLHYGRRTSPFGLASLKTLQGNSSRDKLTSTSPCLMRGQPGEHPPTS